MLTPAAAQALQDDATGRGTWLTWVVSAADLEHPGKFKARAHTAGHQGGVYLPGALVAATLGELRAQLPTGLTRHERTSAYPPDVVEDWDCGIPYGARHSWQLLFSRRSHKKSSLAQRVRRFYRAHRLCDWPACWLELRCAYSPRHAVFGGDAAGARRPSFRHDARGAAMFG